MLEQNLAIELHVQQIRDGLHYMGYARIDQVKFDYELQFEVDIETFVGLHLAANNNQMQQHNYQLTIKCNEEMVNSQTPGYQSLTTLILTSAVLFSANPQIRVFNQEMSKNASPVGGDESAVIIGMSTQIMCPRTSDLCRLIRDQTKS
jgi:hypothetical protein